MSPPRPYLPRAARPALAWLLLTAAATAAAAADPQQGVNTRSGSASTAGAAGARGNADTLPSPPPVISLEQIDRYDAITQLQKDLKAHPDRVDDWVILGEVAHEVAMDAPADQAKPYFTMSRDAFEKALELAPQNAGLKAAVQFARDQETGASAFEQQRDLATVTYLEARRRDLQATGHVPYIRTYGSQQPALAVQSRPGAPVQPRPGVNASVGGGTLPGAGATAGTGTVTGTGAGASPAVSPGAPAGIPQDVARATGAGAPDAPVSDPTTATSPDPIQGSGHSNYGIADAPLRTPAASPVYQPFVMPGGQPLTYRQYSSGYFPPGLLNNPAVAPVTAQRAATGAGVGAARPNAFERSVLNNNGGRSGTGTGVPTNGGIGTGTATNPGPRPPTPPPNPPGR